MFLGSTMASSLPSTSCRTRRCLTLDTKVDMIRRTERGQKNCDICRALEWNGICCSGQRPSAGTSKVIQRRQKERKKK